MKNEAIGTWEAACLLGVHWTRPKKMAESGVLSARAVGGAEGREFAVYSARECNDNFLEYASRRGSHGRGRTAVDLRPDVIKQLSAKGRPQIDFEDAVGVTEAAEILGVFWTRVARMVDEGKIVGRVLWSNRGDRSRLWIFSRKSCTACAKEIRRLEAAGEKLGRPRKASVAR